MQKVITINLNGNAYQLDESAYDALRAYLNLAETQLKDNPDRAEVVADFEQAIAEKCRKRLGPNKTVVTAAEMQQIVKEMGPVEGADAAQPGANADAPPAGQPWINVPPWKRLYRIRDGQQIGGVCSGLAAYFNIDVTLIRIGFLVLLWTGIGLLAYLALMVVVPYAETSEQHAAAHGQRPFNAQEIIDRARRTAAEVTGTIGTTGREWTRQWREHWRERAGAGYPMPSVSGFVMAVFGIVSVALFTILIGTIVSLSSTGVIWGWPLPAGIPLWAGILVLVVVFQVVMAPIRAARHASYYMWGRSSAWFAVWDGLVAIALTTLVIWLLYTHMPPPRDFREFMQNLPGAMRSLSRDAHMWFRAFVDAFR